MIHAKKLNNTIANILLASLTSLSFIYALISSLGFRYSPLRILEISVVMLTIYTVVFWNKLSRWLTFGISLSAIIVFIIYTLKRGLLLKYTFFISDTLYWFSDYMFGSSALNARYETYVTFLLCFIITLAVFFLTIKYFSFPIILLGGVALFASQWILEFFISYNAFYLFVFTALLYYFKHIYLKKFVSESGDYVSPVQFMFWIMPICCLIFVAAVSIPTSSKPIEWKWLDEKIILISNYFNNEYSNSFSKFDYFSIEYTGFGKNGKLGGKVKLDNTVVLEVEAERPGYLRASGKDTYTGNAWIDTEKDQIELNSMESKLVYDFLELQVGFPLLAGGVLRNFDDYVSLAEHNIWFKGLKTKSLFVPYLSQKVNFTDDSKFIAYVNNNSTIVMNKTAGKDFNYKTESIAVNNTNEAFKNIIRKSNRGFYSNIQKYKVYSDVFRFNVRTNPILIRGEEGGTIRYMDFVNRLAENADEIYSKYTQIPDITPQRVLDLAAEITVQYENDYDRVKAIEQYLSRNFQYTLSPKSTPKDRDFVDYFLFDLKQGYCTYYASAMAILVRGIGLPSRYVEGYMMPSELNIDNNYTVTNENAHAWVEVYFEGFGWLPFEPTAPFTAGFYTDNSVSQPENRDSEDTASESEEMTPEPSPIESILTPEDITGTTELKLPISLILISSIASLILLLLIVMGVNILRRKKKISRIMKMNTRNGILALYKHFVLLMKLQGYEIKGEETPTQYSERIDDHLYLSPINFKSVTEIFMVARYSRNELEEISKEIYVKFYKKLIENCKYNMGRYKFFLYRYLFGRL